MNYNPQIHHRRSIRLKEYDYSGEGIYFITLCVEGRLPLLGTIEKGEMKLSTFGSILAEEWENSENIRENCTFGEYIIMPDHFHGIIQINHQIKQESTPNPGEFKSPSNTIGAIIRGIKGATTKRIKSFLYPNIGESSSGEVWGELRFAPNFAPTEAELKILKQFDPNKSIWQRNYFERIIRTPDQLENTINYIKQNPINWERKHAKK